MSEESTSTRQVQKHSSLLAGSKTPHVFLLICLFASQLSGNSEIWRSAESGFGGFRLMGVSCSGGALLLPNRLLWGL